MSRGPQWKPTGNPHIDAATYPLSRAMTYAKVTKVRRNKDFRPDTNHAIQACATDWENHRITVWHRAPDERTYEQELEELRAEIKALKLELSR